MSTAPRLLGAIIAGGAARRFGSDKGAALLGGRALIDHVRDALAPLVEHLVIVGRDWDDLPRIDDLPCPSLGPVGGIAGALHHAADNGFSVVLTIGCDTPRVSRDVMQALVEQAPAWCADNPVMGAWPADLANQALRFAGNDPKRSVRGWAHSVGAVAVSCPLVANLNTPDDLAKLERG
jgi:molybdenum cofactor guanylyltransferase